MKNIIERLIRWKNPQLYLHIGMPKTGTSTIQGLLFDNRKTLDQHGYFYPVATLGGSSDYAYAHHNLAHAILENNNAPWQKLQGELAANKRKRIIISSEAFSNCRHPDHLKYIHEYLCHFPIKIVVYVRRQDEMLQGLYQTLVTFGDLTDPLADYLEMILTEHPHTLDYYSLINDLFAREFGKENILLRVYEKSSLHEGDLLKDFLKTTGFSASKFLQLDVPNNNLSFDARTLEIFRQLKIQLKGEDEEALEHIRRIMRKQNKRSAFQGNNIITQEQSSRIMASVNQSNEKLAREYLQKEDGVLFSEPAMKFTSNETVNIGDQDIEHFLQSADPGLANRFNRTFVPT